MCHLEFANFPTYAVNDLIFKPTGIRGDFLSHSVLTDANHVKSHCSGYNLNLKWHIFIFREALDKLKNSRKEKLIKCRMLGEEEVTLLAMQRM